MFFHRLTRMQALVHICEYLPRRYEFYDNFTDDWIYDVIADIAPPHLETWFHCKWQEQYDPECSVPVFTEEGLCFAFNGINSHEIYTDE